MRDATFLNPSLPSPSPFCFDRRSASEWWGFPQTVRSHPFSALPLEETSDDDEIPAPEPINETDEIDETIKQTAQDMNLPVEQVAEIINATANVDAEELPPIPDDPETDRLIEEMASEMHQQNSNPHKEDQHD